MLWHKKSIQQRQLMFLTTRECSYRNRIVSYIENGQEKKGIYTPVSEDFPELLLKMTVAASQIKRVFQRERTADERLVLDDEGKVVAKFSHNLPDFEPFINRSDNEPRDLQKKERVIPQTTTLIDHNITELLLGRWFFDDDNCAAHNLGLVGDTSFKYFWNWFTQFMKPRPSTATNRKSFDFTVRDWAGFPCITDSEPFSWPTNTHASSYSTRFPGIMTHGAAAPFYALAVLRREYADSSQFQLLAQSPKVHQQKLAAALQILVTYQPAMMRKHLQESFGDAPLNYTSLPSNLRSSLESEFPQYCNAETNKKPFIDFILTLFQKHYDSLYRVVVFFMGCQNNGHDISLPSTYTSLCQQPSMYNNIKRRVRDQNHPLESKFNEEELDRRYLTIFRDAKRHYNLQYSLQLVGEVSLLIKKLGIIRFAHSCIIPPMEIDGNRLNDFVDSLEAHNSAIAHLTCGLLLAGQIDTVSEISHDSTEYDEYIKKRLHDAISFYIKASADKKLKSLVDFLLWDMKMSNPIPSIQNRLASFDLTPQGTDIINTYNHSNRRLGVSLPFVKDLGIFNYVGHRLQVQPAQVLPMIEYRKT